MLNTLFYHRLLLSVLLSALCGCGQKGPLYLPEHTTHITPTTSK